jgi:hypothetical protein
MIGALSGAMPLAADRYVSRRTLIVLVAVGT